MAIQDNAYTNVRSTSIDGLTLVANRHHNQPLLSPRDATESFAHPEDQAGRADDTVEPHMERRSGSSSESYHISAGRQPRHAQPRRDEQSPPMNMIQIPAYEPMRTASTPGSTEEWHRELQSYTGYALAPSIGQIGDAAASGVELSMSLPPHIPIRDRTRSVPPLEGYPISRPQIPDDAHLWPQPMDAFLYPTLDYSCYCHCAIGECKMLWWVTENPHRETEEGGLDEQVISERNWRRHRDIHLRKPSSTAGMAAVWRDLMASLPAIEGIPGSLKLLVVEGGRLFYDELMRQIQDRGTPLEHPIGRALQRREMAICDAFLKQLEVDSIAIEEWEARQRG